MEFRCLTIEEIRDIYYEHLTSDFPRAEVKPLENIEKMIARNAYECLGLFEDQSLRGYACMVADHESGYLLLDYLAVTKGTRGMGYGSRILDHLRTWYRDRNGIFIESEALRTSENEEQLRVRRRRLDFYEKNGCEMTRVNTAVFGVEYSIFYLGLREVQPDHRAQLDHIYHLMFPPAVYARHARVWTTDPA